MTDQMASFCKTEVKLLGDVRLGMKEGKKLHKKERLMKTRNLPCKSARGMGWDEF